MAANPNDAAGPQDNPEQWNLAVRGGDIEHAENAANIVSNGGVPDREPSSRLGVLFSRLGRNMLDILGPGDILNVMASDPYARPAIRGIEHGLNGGAVNVRLVTRGIIEYEFRPARVNGQLPQVEHPNEEYGECDIEKSFENKVERYPLVSGVEPTQESSHRTQRQIGQLIIPIQGLPVVLGQRLPAEWAYCRRYSIHANSESGHCIICRVETYVKIHGMGHENDYRTPLYMPVCSVCHNKAIKKYPWGYGPKQLTTPHSATDIPNCDCMEAIRYKTCYACCDLVLHYKIRSDRVKNWPGYKEQGEEQQQRAEPRHVTRSTRKDRAANKALPKWPICPCGREINPTAAIGDYPTFKDKRDSYRPSSPGRTQWGLFDGESSGTYDFDVFTLNHWQAWTVFCIACDSIWVPRTKPQSSIQPADYTLPNTLNGEPKTYKQALEIGDWKTRPFTDRPPRIVNGKEVWKIQSIDASRIVAAALEYQVTWAGQRNGRDLTWYPVTDIDAWYEILAFHTDNPDAPKSADILPAPPAPRRARKTRRKGPGRPRRR